MQWQKNMQLIDANALFRCILNDCPEMTEKAVEIIDAGAYTKPEILAEVVYVLQKVYAVQRPKIKDMLQNILENYSLSGKRKRPLCYGNLCIDFS